LLVLVGGSGVFRSPLSRRDTCDPAVGEPCGIDFAVGNCTYSGGRGVWLWGLFGDRKDNPQRLFRKVSIKPAEETMFLKAEVLIVFPINLP